jgi:hypothetical protein
MRHSFQIPSDIKPGTYVVRTELLALHANTPTMKMTPVNGPEFYLHCFNVEIIGSGTATPEGVTFPGAYKAGDPGLFFSPYYGDGSGVAHNSKYVSNNKPVYHISSHGFNNRLLLVHHCTRVSMMLLLAHLLLLRKPELTLVSSRSSMTH